MQPRHPLPPSKPLFSSELDLILSLFSSLLLRSFSLSAQVSPFGPGDETAVVKSGGTVIFGLGTDRSVKQLGDDWMAYFTSGGYLQLHLTDILWLISCKIMS